jgi:glycosyltransferase 2 family protein
MQRLKHSFITFVGLAISCLALFYLAQQFDISELLNTFQSIDLFLLAPILPLIVASFAIRAQRWRLLVQHKPPIRYWPSLSALMIGYLFNNILPARAGDIARALELGRTERMSRTKVLATLVSERTLDLVATLSILAVVLLSYPALPPWLQMAGFTVAGVALASLTMLVLAHTTGRRWIPGLLVFFTSPLPQALREKIGQMAMSALEGIAGMFRPGHAAAFLILTALIWSIEVFIVYLSAASIGLDLPLGNALFVLLFLAVGSMVPSAPGFVGTYEFFGVSALALISITGTSALAFVVLLHVITLSGSSAIGIVFYLLRPRTIAKNGKITNEIAQ